MAAITTTGTLTAGNSRTFALAPGSALTLTLLPNCRVTVTETPETVSASDAGGNSPRTHNHQFAGVFTYGPYVMGGSVVVDNASNSGSTVTWGRKDTTVSTSSDGLSLVSGDGNVVAPSQWPGLGGRAIADVLPRHVPVFIPDQLQSQIAAVASPGSSIANSYDTSVKEFGAGSMKIAVPGAVGSDVTFRVAIPADLYGNQPKIGSRLNIRIRCSNWAAVTRLYVSPSEQAGSSHRYIFTVAELTGVDCEHGQKSIPSAWNDVFRTIQFDAYRKIAVGTPAAWATDSSMTSTYAVDGMTFTIRTSGAVDLYIDRMYSPEWPVGVYTLVGDGAYDTFQSNAVAAFNRRGWKLGVAAFKVNDIVGHYPGRGYPTEAQLVAMAAAGHDVVPHYCTPNASFNHTEAAFTGATTAAQVRSAATALINRAAREHGANAKSLQYVQFLQNAGKYDSTNLAGVLAKFGAAHGRGPCSDAQFGVDPWHASMSSNASYRNNEAGTDKAIMAGWIPKRGRFNAGYEQAWFANVTADNDTDRLARDTYASSMLQLAINRAAALADGVFSYTHYIETYGTANRSGSGNPEPSVNNSGANFWRDHLVHLDEKFNAGSLVVLSPSQRYSLTYGRQGDVYLRWDGEWVNRSDGSIAF